MNDALNGIRILVVEDDDDTRELLKVLLETQGSAVTAAASVPEALAAYDRTRRQIPRILSGLPGIRIGFGRSLGRNDPPFGHENDHKNNAGGKQGNKDPDRKAKYRKQSYRCQSDRK